METLQPRSDRATEATATGKHAPHTPPYTPYRAKRRFERSDSPASISSIQPAETTSPAKKIARRSAEDHVRVEELVEGDLGYATDLDVVYPEELEEKTSSTNEDESSNDEGDESETGISQRFQELGCHDSDEAEFEKKRREKHLRHRTNSRLFKRSHSQIIKSDSEVSDIEAMADHDLNSSARRLRRRVGEASGIEVFEEGPRSSPEPRSAALAPPIQMREPAQQRGNQSESSSESDHAGDPMDTQ